MIQLSRTTFAALRECGEKHGAEAVLEQFRQYRAGYPELGEMESLDALLESKYKEEGEVFDKYSSSMIQIATADPESLDEPPQWAALLLDDRKERVNRAVRQLPLPEKRVVRMKYWEEMPLRAIGLYMGLSQARIDQIHHQALGRLRARLIAEIRPEANGKAETT